MDANVEEQARSAAFIYLDSLGARSGGLVTRQQLEAFELGGRRIPLIAPRQGIWKPAVFEVALSILTTYSSDPESRPYEDDPGPDGYNRYKWRGTDGNHANNRAVRRAMELGTPLIWLTGVAPGVFQADYPVFIAGEEPDQTQFVLALDADQLLGWRPGLEAEPQAPARRYAEMIGRRRVHQRVFRSRLIVPYEGRCALCRLKHLDLLEAAHIRPDRRGGEPIIPNGILMCAIHHRAYDANIVGVDPRHRIEVRRDVLEEVDGPTLQHALQGLHGELLRLPRRRVEQPRTDLLEERYEEFRAAG
jgi:putative restriction endonuclease